ncbi:CHAP domain-containing protein [Streptomyces sp. NBC_01483]|uniref:CHAP domain-containing protein n=1 Tax=Streptomyces sp. NBC_01483 TaxID=2903883 RepID=UPI002E33729D|nr:CHAP domain-containing protein [Streptomyces sp. NBC_01483]
MEKKLGTGEPNSIQDWFRQRNGPLYAGNFPWCDATITWAAVDSGNYNEVCFGIDWAYTVAHAARFDLAGQWTPMTKGVQGTGIRRGDIVFFDWNHSSAIAAIDHVGLVTGVSGDAVMTIEGNTANVCARRVRYAADIAGFGRPKYKTPPVKTLPAVSLAHVLAAQKADTAGAQGSALHRTEGRLLENALKAKGLLAARWVDGSLGSKTEDAYSEWQKAYSAKHNLGWTGTDVNGKAGMTSLKALGAETGLFRVVA